jgi:hypothetical protein
MIKKLTGAMARWFDGRTEAELHDAAREALRKQDTDRLLVLGFPPGHLRFVAIRTETGFAVADTAAVVAVLEADSIEEAEAIAARANVLHHGDECES